ncbi:MAG: hypothetical protein ACK4YP_02170 [Myxococcota bacterium]
MQRNDRKVAGDERARGLGDGAPGASYRRSQREPVEIAMELRGLSAVLFVAACEARAGRGALLLASEALAEAPLHTGDEGGRALLALVRAAGVALRSGLQALTAHEASQVDAARSVSIRLARIEAELSP